MLTILVLFLTSPFAGDREVKAQSGELTYFDAGRWLGHENLLTCFNELH